MLASSNMLAAVKTNMLASSNILLLISCRKAMDGLSEKNSKQQFVVDP